MKRYLVALAVLSLASASSGAERRQKLLRILDRQAVPSRDFVCPCEFDLGNHVDGEVGSSLIKTGGSKKRLRTSAGKPFVSRTSDGCGTRVQPESQ